MALLVHVLSAVGIFVGLALEWMVLVGLEGAHTDSDLGEALSGFAVLPVRGAPSTILVSQAGSLRRRAGMEGGPRAPRGAGRAVRRQPPGPGGESAAAGARPTAGSCTVSAPLPRRSVLGRIWIAVGIVYLMAMKPALAASVVVFAVSGAVAAATLVFHPRG